VARKADLLQEAAMRGIPHLRATIVLSWLAATMFAAGGCSSADQAGVSSTGEAPLSEQKPVLHADTLDGEGPDEVNALAAQAERDVSDFLKLRRQAAERQAAAPAAEGEAPDATSGSAREAIVWNEPPADSRRAGREPAPGRVDEPPITQSPLFRDPVESLDVGETPGEGEDPAGPQSAASAAGDGLDLLLVKVRQHLNSQAAYSDQPLRELLGIAAMGLVDPELRLNPQAFPDLSETERELLTKLQGFFAKLGEDLDGSIEAEEAIVNAVLELQKSLVQEPELKLPAAAMCWRVGGFGDYQPFERNAFLAHSEQQVILYLEIDGFTSELNKMNQWLTEISQQLEIINDSDGIPVWSEPWQKAVDVTSHQRRDFFTTQIITLPKPLSVGRYHLKIRVRDERSGAEAEESITFEMVADSKLSAKVPR
jgi:hypothetical protein